MSMRDTDLDAAEVEQTTCPDCGGPASIFSRFSDRMTISCNGDENCGLITVNLK